MATDEVGTHAALTAHRRQLIDPKIDKHVTLDLLTAKDIQKATRLLRETSATALLASAMKMIAEYLECALQFERWTGDTDDASLKQQFLKQAAEYRKLAEQRAVEISMPKPPTQSK